MSDTIHTPQTEEKSGAASRNWAAWTSLLFMMLSWAILMWLNGYVALGVAAVAVALGFVGCAKSSTAIKNLAITSIIAAMVLIVVVSAYLIVIKIGLG